MCPENQENMPKGTKKRMYKIVLQIRGTGIQVHNAWKYYEMALF